MTDTDLTTSAVATMRATLDEAIDCKTRIRDDDALMAAIVAVAERLVDAFRAGNRAIFAGNGISASDAQHLVTEFVSRFAFDRPALPALSLATDAPVMTAIANDYGYENLFARQLTAQARAGDVFVGLTTSGRSPNILAAFDACRTLGVTSVALCAETGELAGVDHVLRVPSRSSPRIQEAHVLIGHLICAHVESRLFEPPR